MRLFKITRTDKVGYDEYDAFVVRARNVEEAFELISDKGNRIDEVLFDLSTCKVEEIIPYGDPEIILGSFIAG